MESFLADLATGITVWYPGAGTWRNYLDTHYDACILIVAPLVCFTPPSCRDASEVDG